MTPTRIEPDDEVYRRLAPETVDFGSNLVRRNAFYTRGEPDPEISVHVKRLTGDPAELLERAGRPNFGLGVLAVSALRELGLRVEYRPTVDDPSHAVILEVSTKADCDRIASATTLVKLPESRIRLS